MSQVELSFPATISTADEAVPPTNDARDRHWSIVRSITFCAAVNLVAWIGIVALGVWLI